MDVKMVGSVHTQRPDREAGTYQMAYTVTTPNGKTGVALYQHEYDKRTVIGEQMYASREIADELREYIGDDSPFVIECFGFPPEEAANADALEQIRGKADVLVFEYND